MQNRSEQMIALRPEIDAEPTSTNTRENFQNKTIRPILKFQNDVFVQAFLHYSGKRRGDFTVLSSSEQKDYIEHAIRNDLKFRNKLVGMVLGLFTLEEWELFRKHEKELIRRTTDMLIQRLQGQLEKLQESA